MSKIGRQPIKVSSANVTINDNTLAIKGSKGSFEHALPNALSVELNDGVLKIAIKENNRENRMLWGLHRALVANKIKGVEQGFETKVTIVGLGFKATLSGKKMTFSLGYTNKIDYDLPDEVSVDIDKTGQNLVFKSADKFILGNVCDDVRKFKLPEPYKGKGIIREHDVVIRKAGKAKSS